MLQLHDPHKISEPILVLSGLSYLIPAYRAYYCNNMQMLYACGFLTFTTVGFHYSRNDYFFAIDLIAIINFLVADYRAALVSGNYATAVFFLATNYSLTSYFVGRQYKIMSFDPDWNTQMFWHALMHVSSAYSACVSLGRCTLLPFFQSS
jgi:hypothetical protein